MIDVVSTPSALTAYHGGVGGEPVAQQTTPLPEDFELQGMRSAWCKNTYR